MKKNIFVILACLIFSVLPSYSLDLWDKNIGYLKQELNKACGSVDKPINLIAITRTVMYNKFKLSTPSMAKIQDVTTVLEEVKNKIPNHNNNNDIKVISFNEMFFSQETPLEKNGAPTDVTHDAVLDEVKKFSNNVKKSIVFVNILYADQTPITKKELMYNYALTKYNELKNRVNKGDLPKLLSEYAWDEISTLCPVTSHPLLNTEKTNCDAFVLTRRSSDKPPMLNEFVAYMTSSGKKIWNS